MSKIPTYTTRASEGYSQMDYEFSDGTTVTVNHGGPEPHALYMNEAKGTVHVGDLQELYSMAAEALHTTHTEVCRNPADGSPYFETYVINDTIPPRFEETNE